MIQSHERRSSLDKWRAPLSLTVTLTTLLGCSAAEESGSVDTPAGSADVSPALAAARTKAMTELDHESLRLVKAAVRRDFSRLGFDREAALEELRLLRVKRVPSPKDAGSSDTVAELHQTFAGLPIIGGSLNAEIVAGEVRAIHGKVVDRAELARKLGSSSAHKTPAEAAQVVEEACGQSSLPVEPENEGPWIDAEAGRFVYRMLCGDAVYEVDAEGGAITGIGPARLEWTPTLAPIRTGRDGDRLSSNGNEWFPSDIGKPNTTMLRQNKVRFDRSPFAADFCYWQMSTYYDGESAAPFPSLRPANDYVRNGIDACSSPSVVFSATSNDRLQEQHAYDRIWLGAFSVNYSSTLKFWNVIPPDTTSTLRVITWRADPEGDHCDEKAGVYSQFYEDIHLCLDHDEYEAYLVPLHEFGHYIADSYGFISGGTLAPPCREKAVQEGVANTIALILEHQRYTGGAETMAAVDRAELFESGPGSALGSMGFHKGNLLNVDAACSAATTGRVMTQVMWKLLNNAICAYDAAENCTIRQIGPSPLPAWVREEFIRVLDLADESTISVEGFLSAIYTRFLVNRQASFTTAEWTNFRSAFTQNGVDLP